MVYFSAPAKRILFVASGLTYGGAETQLIAISRRLKELGHTPSLYLLTKEAPRRGDLDAIGVPIIVDQKRSRFDWRVLLRLRRHMRELEPDLVHSFLFDANVYSRIAAVGLGIPILNSERNHGYALNKAQAAVHYLTRHLADAVIANSFAGELFARQMFGFDESRTHTVWNGIDLARIDARMAAATNPYRQLFFGAGDIRLAVFVGAIKAQKDPLLAVAVAEQLIDTDPRWRVAFVGASLDMSRVGYATTSGAESATLTEQVASRWQASPHRDQIAFVGQREDAVEIIAAADVLFSTSHHEGFPNVVLEAMAVGTPVVSTIYSDIELILPADLLVHNRDAAAISAAITRVAAHRDQIGPALRAWVEARATIEYSADQMIRIYASHVEAARQT